MATIQPFVPAPISSSDVTVEGSAGFKAGYAAGLRLARAEARAEALAGVQEEMAALRRERDAAMARAAGTDAAFQHEKSEVASLAADLAATISALNNAAREWREREATSIEAVQHDAISFALDVAESIGLALPDADRLRSALASCVGLLGISDPVRVRVHSTSANALALLPDGWDPALVTLILDDAIPPGEAVCEQGPTEVRAGLTGTLQRIRQQLGLPPAPAENPGRYS